MKEDPRRRAAIRLAKAAMAEGRPLQWFEELYREGKSTGAILIPWADLQPNPNLVEWLDREWAVGATKRALVVGCGLGDDAEELAERGFDVTAFDIAPTAVEMATERFPGSRVEYGSADLLHPPPDWIGRFDLVVEAYTLQAIPADLRRKALRRLPEFLATGGALLIIARGRNEDEDLDGPPWPLTRAELETLQHLGLQEISFEDYLEREMVPVRRFRAVYRRQPDAPSA